MYRIFFQSGAKPFSSVQKKMVWTITGVFVFFLVFFMILMIAHRSTVGTILEDRKASFETTVETLMQEQQAFLMNKLNDTLWFQMLLQAEREPSHRLNRSVYPGLSLQIYDEKRRLYKLYSHTPADSGPLLNDDELNQIDNPTAFCFFSKKAGDWYELSAVRMRVSEKKHPTHARSQRTFYILVSRRLETAYLTKLSLISGSRVQIAEPETPCNKQPEEIAVFWPMKNINQQTIGELRWFRRNPFGSAYQKWVVLFYWLMFGMVLSTLTVITLLTHSRMIRPINLITRTLQNNDYKSLCVLTERNDEFSILARLIDEHQQQKEQLNREIQERQKAEADLVRREALIRSLFSASSVGMARLHHDHIEEANDAFCRLVGYAPDEITGKNCGDFFADPEAYAQQKYEAEQALRQKGTCRFESLWQKKDGTLLNVFISCSPAQLSEDIPDIIINVIDITDRKSAENALQESEKKYRTLVNHIGEGIIILNQQERFVFVNPSAASIFGLTEPELIGEPITRFLTQSMYERLHAHSLLHYEGQKTTLEIEIIRPDYETRHLLITVTPLFGAENHYTGSLAVLLDITERKKTLDALRHSEEQFKQITDHMLDMISRLNANGRLTYISPSHRPILGYQPEDMLGRSYLEFIHPDDAERYLQALHHHIRNHKSVKLEFRIQHASGHYLWLEAVGNPLLENDQSLAGSVFATRDISQRKSVENDLHQSRRMLQTVLDSIPVGVFWKNEDGVYMGCNRKFAEDNGFASSLAIMGKTDDKLCSDKELVQSYRETDQQILQSGNAVLNCEECRLNKHGEKRISLTSKIPLFNPEGYRIGILGVYEDITDRKHAEEALRESEEKYRRLVELSPWPIAIHCHGRIVYINPAGAEMMGYTRPSEMLGLPLMEFVHPDYQQTIKNRLALMHEKLIQVPVIEEKFIRRDGRPIDVEVAAIPFVQQGETYIQVMIRDMTERKKAEEALKHSEKRYRDLVDQSLGFICIHDLDGVMTLVNPASAHALNYEPEELLGVNISNFLTPAFQKRFQHYLNEIRIKKSYSGVIHVVDQKNNRKVWMFNNRLYEDENHQPYILCHAQDITELENNRKERERLIKELKNAIHKVRTLSGLLPICAACKKIRDDKGYWNQLEHYITDHSNAEFTHSICPDCQRRLYPELYESDPGDTQE